MITRRLFATSTLLLVSCGGGSDAPNPNPTPSPPMPTPPADAWRPRYHYTPRYNWMNDPNGLVFFEGEYHLYYQHNPFGDDWGNIGWGHAVSTDLVSWRELPVAIPATERVMAFSGSIVVDTANSGGFAAAGAGEPALVAFFTGFDPVTKIQAQHLAYSRDRGRSFTRFPGNPVVDIGSTEFRDPKVFWHAPTGRWVMLVVAALQQQVWFYVSNDLKAWTKVSAFGPAGSAAHNIWEVPELVELPIDGDPARRRWVLFVSVNHGSLWGGSGVQYFVGDFDGTRFVADASDTVDAVSPPPGELIADFEGGRWPAGWSASGTAFGTAPAAGALDGQQFVSGFRGGGLANSFHGGDGSTGTLTSPAFTISRPFISFLIAGGHTEQTCLELLIDGLVVRRTSGDDTEVLKWNHWDVTDLRGRQGVLRAVDAASGTWGHVNVDHVVMGDAPVTQPDMATITLWADHGRDFYAPITFANVPDGRVLWLGWMSNWEYARTLPTSPWRGQQSAVRQLDLVTTPHGLRLRQRMADEVQALVEPASLLALGPAPAASVAASLATLPGGAQLRLLLVVPLAGLASPFGLEVFKSATASVRVGFDPARQVFFVDRRPSSAAFGASSEVHEARRVSDAPEIRLEVWIDACTLEVFADDGTVVISDLVLADPAATGVGLFHGSENPTLQSLELRAVRTSMAVAP